MRTPLPGAAPLRDLTPLMRPASVAVLGASPRPDSFGNSVVKNLLAAGYEGLIYPIHPSAAEVEGLRCFADLQDLPEAPDCAVVALPADKVLPALTQAARRGLRAAVVFASGFAELGEAGRALQAELAELCARTGLLVCGPNCLGLANLHERISLYSAPLPEPLRVGGVAIASHSGSGCIALAGVGRFGLSHLVSVGNAAVLDVDDYLAFFADDPNTRVAALFMESVRHPSRFLEAAARMRAAGKPVVVLKVGRSAQGAAATAAHTGSLAGSHAAAVDFFRQAGVVLVDDMDEMVETCALMVESARRPAGDGLAVINVSGGEVALTCDLAQAAGLRFPRLARSTLDALRACLPAFATPSNPLDATGAAVFDMTMYARALDALLADPDVALLAVSQDCPVSLGAQGAETYRAIAAATAAAAARTDKPMAFYSNVGGGLHPRAVAPLAGSGVAALQGARAALVAMRHFIDWHLWQPCGASKEVAVLEADAAWSDRLASGQALSEHEAKQFLEAHGIRTTREARAADAQQAAQAAEAIGFPVVMKIDSADIPHKTEAGGVRLALRTPAEVRAAFADMLATVRERMPAARIDGVLIQEMVQGGVEMIAGLSRQAPFGHAVVAGSGGVWVELVRDSSLALSPIDAPRATALVGSTRASRLLDGFRGAPPADRGAFEALIVRLSQIGSAYADYIEAIDLNPVAVLAEGEGVRVLDALVELRRPAFHSMNPGDLP
ncbi:succinyl-CoA synthetase subunit beta [Variovorax sp. PBS-H4]|uniref:acetate--CoA ligase family protein n=1 Tax=Variovorax sp. PBS-H4 TaxID=434008 RepID=UPI001318F31C|nr:acetate--CoA ligase family protein [Variovorax sp. PBS-H4]VTU18408.1 succinyl-CoA synthetase subunit beta [Variovorax sp. PBS-H4]